MCKSLSLKWRVKAWTHCKPVSIRGLRCGCALRVRRARAVGFVSGLQLGSRHWWWNSYPPGRGNHLLTRTLSFSRHGHRFGGDLHRWLASDYGGIRFYCWPPETVTFAWIAPRTVVSDWVAFQCWSQIGALMLCSGRDTRSLYSMNSPGDTDRSIR